MSQRLVIIGPRPPPNGGMAIQAQELYQMVQESDWQVVFVALNFPLVPGFLDNIKGVRGIVRLFAYLWILLFRLQKNDVVHLLSNSGWSWHLYSSPALLLARLKGCHVIINYRGGEAKDFLEKQSKWVLPFFRLAKKVVVPSGYLADVFANWSIQAVVIPNTLDTGFFSRDERIVRTDSIAVVRNLEKIYGVDIAIKAFARVLEQFPDYELNIAGEGAEKQSLRSLAKTLGISDKVHFLGRLDKVQVRNLLAQSTVFLNTSRKDNSPNSLLEAMSMQLPVVTTDAGGIPYIVSNGSNAAMCAVDDVAGITTEVVGLLSDREKRQHYIASATRGIEKYQKQRVKKSWLEMYKQVV